MIEKKMKSSKIKTVVVECKLKDSVDKKQFDLDSEIFDDILLEAATRFAEQHVKKKNVRMAPILTAWDKKNTNNFEKYYCYNSYFVVINAGFHKKAEIMRKNFLAATGIDLKLEKMKTESNGKSGKNN
jgi:hypothetical protein